MRIGFAMTSFALLVSTTLLYAASADDYAPASLTVAQILAREHAASGALARGQYLEVERSTGGGPFSTSSGRYQGQSWYRDENGIVVLESGFHGKVDPNALAWKHPEDPTYRVRVLGLTQTTPQEYVVEANPPGGQDEYRYYDAKMFLLDNDVWFGVDRLRHVESYSQYQTLFGETILFQSQYRDGNARDDEETRILSFTQSPSSKSAMAIPSSRPLLDLSKGPVTLPARFTDDNGIVVPVTIAGQSLDFMLDSGSDSLVVDTGAVHRLGLTTHGQSTATIGGTVDTSETVVPDMAVGDIYMHNVVVGVVPLNFQGEGSHVVGLLGCDFLASAIVGFDFKKQTVTLYPRALFDPTALGVRAVPLQVDDCVPRVAAEFENVPGSFLMDTGAFGMVLYPGITAEAIGGEVYMTTYDVSDFIFWSIKYDVGRVRVPDPTSTFADPDYDGIIGRNPLKEYVFYLDYADSLAFFKPNV